jgi:hypothetical protein
MNSGHCRLTLVLLSALVVLLWTSSVSASTDPAPKHSRTKETRKKSPDPPHAIDMSALSEQVAALEKRVEELARQAGETAELKDQVNDLKGRLDIAEARLSAGEAVRSGLPGEVASLTSSSSGGTGRLPGETDLPLPSAQAGAQQQEPDTLSSISKRTAALEASVKRIGPIRFGGDFRLRADGIFRDAYPNPKPGESALTHIQNARVRYRLRLNLDTDVNKWISFHGQLATGPVVNSLTLDQDFTSTVTRHPLLISEAWVDFHPKNWFSGQAGRVQEVFSDNTRFIFDDDVRFNGFNERFVKNFADPVAGFKSVEVRAGQYIFTNPNVPIVSPANIGPSGAVIGSTGRASHLFDQGVRATQRLTERTSHEFTVNFQVYHQPSEIQFASTAAGTPILVQPGLGVTLSGAVPQTGNATTLPGGAIYTAGRFEIARFAYQLTWGGFKSGKREYPVVFNGQYSKNVGTGQKERDGMLTFLRVGRVSGFGDMSFMYLFSIKGANAIISQFTDDDLGTTTGVNLRTHHLRWDIGLGKGVQLQSLFFIQNELRNSGQFPNFFVPVNAYTPTQYRLQEQIVFTF